jgi:WD40 repeat protein
VEVWDSLTLEKQSSLQLPKSAGTRNPSYYAPDTLSYSPDGYSLVGSFGSTITIWDIQTGGVVKEIECRDIDMCPMLLVWSLDGQTNWCHFSSRGRNLDCVYI